jgi:5-bromo-4-chloroindolyl phosphate hydrolysis protein
MERNTGAGADMQRIILIIAFILAVPDCVAAQNTPNYDEQREILLYLSELPLVRSERDLLREGLNECRGQVTQWQGVYEQCRGISEDMIRSKDREIQLFKEKSEFYETAYRALLQRKSWFCRAKPYMTFGILMCK